MRSLVRTLGRLDHVALENRLDNLLIISASWFARLTNRRARTLMLGYCSDSVTFISTNLQCARTRVPSTAR